MAFSYAGFKEKLDNEYEWPALYMFKFIVPKKNESGVKELFPDTTLQTKDSRSGKYVSFTAKLIMESSDEVIGIYKEAQKIKGIIAL